MDYDEALPARQAAGYVDEAGPSEILDTTLAVAAPPGPHLRRQAEVAGLGRRQAQARPHRDDVAPRGRRLEVLRVHQGREARLRRRQPYVDQDGESYCPWIFESANVDRENNRYGEMRHLIDPQDEINKRRSKALHLLNSRGVIATEGAVNDVNAPAASSPSRTSGSRRTPAPRSSRSSTARTSPPARRSSAPRPWTTSCRPGRTRRCSARGPQDQSGRAIEAQQAGGLVEQSDLMDTLRRSTGGCSTSSPR
jgi:hypothetical protein